MNLEINKTVKANSLSSNLKTTNLAHPGDDGPSRELTIENVEYNMDQKGTICF